MITSVPREILSIILRDLVDKRTTWLVCRRWQQVIADLIQLGIVEINLWQLHTYPIMTGSFIARIQDTINCVEVLCYYKLSEEFIEKYQDILD